MAPLTPQQQDFLIRVRDCIPIAEARGVPGPVMIAQAAIESDWGRSGLARFGSGFFGVKARVNWNGKVYSGTTREWLPGRGHITIPGTNQVYPSFDEAVARGCHRESLFRAYDTFEENVRDYVEFFRQNPRYHQALGDYASTRDPRRFALKIAAAGYATSPTYGQTLIVVMDRYVSDLLPARAGLTVSVNGQTVPSGSVRIVDGRVFVHVRPLAAALGMRVHYDSRTKTVRIEEGRR